MIAVLIAFATAAAPVSGPLKTMFEQFASSPDKARASQVIAAAYGSPELLAQLNELAAKGTLKGFALTTASDGPFKAYVKNGVVSFTPEFIDEQALERRVGPDSPPRLPGDKSRSYYNLTFILGYMASKLETAPERAAFDAQLQSDLKTLIANTPKGEPLNVTELVRSTQLSRNKDEARAYLQGWNDEVNAARAANGAPLTLPQAVDLLDGRNTGVLVRATRLPPANHVVIIPTFQAPVDEHNIEAVAAVVGPSPVPDFGVSDSIGKPPARP